jgi:hypothetical protein
MRPESDRCDPASSRGGGAGAAVDGTALETADRRRLWLADVGGPKQLLLLAGELFSIGAAFCSRQQTLTTCTEVAGRCPIWVSKENDKFCDRNSSLTPP